LPRMTAHMGGRRVVAEAHKSGSWVLRPRCPLMNPAQLQVLISQLTGVADEMGSVLRRSAFSPNIKRRADCSAALFTPKESYWFKPSTSGDWAHAASWRLHQLRHPTEDGSK